MTPARLHKIRTRIGGEEPLRLDFDDGELNASLLAYQYMIEEHPGFICKETRRGEREWRTIYECDSIESAKALYAKLIDPDNAVAEALEELAAQTAARDGVTFAVSWQLTRRP